MTPTDPAERLSRRLRAYVKAEAKFGAEVYLDPDTAEAAADTIDALRARLAEAEAVIAPFWEAWQAVDGVCEAQSSWPTDDVDAWVSGGQGSSYPLFKFGDLRRAAAFYVRLLPTAADVRGILAPDAFAATAQGGEPAP